MSPSARTFSPQQGSILKAPSQDGSLILFRVIAMRTRSIFSVLIAFMFSVAPTWALAATDQIGLAAVVRNNVSQVEPSVSKILQGDDIVRDEVVQTLTDSTAKFVLKDSTNLMLGPNSRLKLDRAVFSGDQGLGDIAIKLSLGAFRFVTGYSAKESYAITTPLATMGVRGTMLDLLIERSKNTVVLKDGQSRVCAGGRCVELVKLGDTAVVTANGARIDIELQPSSSWSFDSACNGMCTPISFAEAENSLTTGSIGAGGAGGGGGGPTAANALPGGGGGGDALPGTQNAGKNTAPGLLTGSGLGSIAGGQVSPF